jgi:DNA modification methylase
VACVYKNRKIIGIELEEKYFNIGKNRVLESQGKVGLFA